MICKECGAYNPDHANFCKVCAANLKEQDTAVSQDNAAPEAEAEPRREPAFQPRVTRSWQKPAPKAEPVKEVVSVEEDEEEAVASAPKALEPEESTTRFTRKRRPVIVEDYEDEDDEYDEDEEDEEEEEEEKPARRKGLFGFGRRHKDEDEDEYDEDEDEDEDEDDEEDEEEEPVRRRGLFARRRRDDDDEDEDDEDEYEDEDDEEDDEDEYEEYEPTPPRGRKKKSQGGGVNLVPILLGAVALILLLMVGIVAYCNLSGGELKGRLPSFLQFNCQGSEKQDNQGNQNNQSGQNDQQSADNSGTANNQQQGGVSGSSIDYNQVDVEETVNEHGQDCFLFKVYLQPGETAIMPLQWQEDAQGSNNNTDGSVTLLSIIIPKDCFKPNAPLESSTYTFTPELYIVSADGTKTLREIAPQTMTFPTVSLSLTTPAEIPAEGIMADKNNILHLEGVVDDHNVTITANGQKLDVYNEGVFMGDYQIAGDVAETVTITASKDNYATATYTFTLNPYVFIPEPMTLTVNGEADDHRAGTASRMTISGTVSPGSTITASCDSGDVACGSVVVNADGTYSMEVAFNSSGYGLYKINLHASQEGYEEKDLSCYVSRMESTKDKMIKAFRSRYYEVYASRTFTEVLANPTDNGAYRFAGKVVSVEEVDGLEVVCFSAKTAKGETTNIYVINMSEKWKPADRIGSGYKIYCTLNGLYTDGTSLYVVAWFAMSD